MSQILVTGFEPFAGAKLNPSELIIQELTGDPDLVPVVLPVSYERASAELTTLIEELRPQAVICLGQAEGRDSISIERVAVNLDDAKLADNDGDERHDSSIVEGGVTAYFTSLPVAEMLNAGREAGVEVKVSLSAGTFVCNHIFYILQRALAGHDVPSGFIHVPLIDEQAEDFPGKPTISLQDQVRAIRAMLKVLKKEI